MTIFFKILFSLSALLFIIYSAAIAASIESDPKFQSYINEQKFQEAIWLASEAGDDKIVDELEEKLISLMTSEDFIYKANKKSGYSKSYLVLFPNGMRSILKPDQWRLMNPLSWIFGNDRIGNCSSEIAASKLDRYFRFNIVPMTVSKKWNGIDYSLQSYIEDVLDGRMFFAKLESSINKKIKDKYSLDRFLVSGVYEEHGSKRAFLAIKLFSKNYCSDGNVNNLLISFDELKMILTELECDYLVSGEYFNIIGHKIINTNNTIVKLVSDYIFDNVDTHCGNWLYWEDEKRIITIDNGLSCRSDDKSRCLKNPLDLETCKFKNFSDLSLHSLPERVKNKILTYNASDILSLLSGLVNVDEQTILNRVENVKRCILEMSTSSSK